ncbi:MAG: hypothetical protein JW712_06925 [Dehalococcoidales bacterium]|nr:hypothetical protein [Dehalococcoidales bacterium]
MYYAMDNPGDENVPKLVETAGEEVKWRFICELAASFGFTGIQINPHYRDEYGLPSTGEYHGIDGSLFIRPVADGFYYIFPLKHTVIIYHTFSD